MSLLLLTNVKITLCIKQIVIHGTHYESDY